MCHSVPQPIHAHAHAPSPHPAASELSQVDAAALATPHTCGTFWRRLKWEGQIDPTRALSFMVARQTPDTTMAPSGPHHKTPPGAPLCWQPQHMARACHDHSTPRDMPVAQPQPHTVDTALSTRQHTAACEGPCSDTGLPTAAHHWRIRWHRSHTRP